MSTEERLRPAAVRVPCSTSNLGSGFDTLGLALDRYLTAAFEPEEADGLRIVRSGTLEGLDASPEDDHLASVFVGTLAAAGAAADGESTHAPRGTLSMHSEIPVARGLGSSAAAFVAGHALARLALGEDIDARGAFRVACAREGHGDNAAPCALGGFRAIVPGEGGPIPLELPLSANVGFAYAAPAQRVSTHAAREVLPRRVTHDVAVDQLGRITALTRGLAEGDSDLIRIGVADELHVPHRLPLIPGAFNAIGAGYDAGAWAVTISGSGSGLIALCPLDRADAVAGAMHGVFDAGAGDPGCVGFALRPDFDGVIPED